MQIHITTFPDRNRNNVRVTVCDFDTAPTAPDTESGDATDALLHGYVRQLLNPQVAPKKRVKAAIELSSVAKPYQFLIDGIVKALAQPETSPEPGEAYQQHLREGLRHQLTLAVRDRAFPGVTAEESNTETGFQDNTGQSVHEEFFTLAHEKMSAKNLAKAACSVIVSLLERSPRQPTGPENPVLPEVVRDLHWRIAREVEEMINRTFVGEEFDSLDQKKQRIAEIRDLLRKCALKVVCPHCQRAADLYVAPRPAKNGSIFFRHFFHGKATNHGGKVVLEPVQVVPLTAVDDDGVITFESASSALTS